MKALIIGRSCYNINCSVNALPELNHKVVSENVVEGAGGFTSVVGYLLGKYGADTYVSGVVGDDSYGSNIRKTLEKVGVHTEYMETAYEKKSNLSINVFNPSDKNGYEIAIEKEKLFLKKNDYPMNPDLLYVDGYDYNASLAAINKYSNKNTIICLQEYSVENVELAKYCKNIIVSVPFAETFCKTKIDFTSSQALLEAYKTILAKFPGKNIIVNLEDKGILYTADNQIKLLKPLAVNILEKTKSLPAFAAGFGYALMQGYDMEKVMTFASIVSSLAMSKLGIESMPELSDIMSNFKQKYPDTAQTTEAVTQPAAPVASPVPAQDPTMQISAAPVDTLSPDVASTVAPVEAPTTPDNNVNPQV